MMREDAYECMWMVSRINMYAARSQKKRKKMPGMIERKKENE